MPDDTGTTIVRLARRAALAATNSLEAQDALAASGGEGGGDRQLATAPTAVRRTLAAKCVTHPPPQLDIDSARCQWPSAALPQAARVGNIAARA